MAIRGRKPKEEVQKVTRVPLGHDWIDVPDLPYIGDRPACPRGLPSASRAYWNVISRMPHCVLFDDGDWQIALSAVTLHAALMNGNISADEKLRAREKLLGVGFANRRDNRIRYVNPLAFKEKVEPEATPEGAADAPANLDAARRRRLMDAP